MIEIKHVGLEYKYTDLDAKIVELEDELSLE